MRKLSWVLAVAVWLTCHSASGVAADTDPGATSVVRQATAEIYGALDSQCEAIARQPERLYSLVDSLLTPRADLDRMAQWVLGKHWREINENQRREFTEEFRTLLVRTYATAVQLASSKDISFLPDRPSGNPVKAVVRTQVKRPGESPVSIHYSLHRKNDHWLVYDIQVDGVSLISNYRTTFAEEISGKGFPRFLDSLKEKNRQPMTAATADEIRSRKAAGCKRSEDAPPALELP